MKDRSFQPSFSNEASSAILHAALRNLLAHDRVDERCQVQAASPDRIAPAQVELVAAGHADIEHVNDRAARPRVVPVAVAVLGVGAADLEECCPAASRWKQRSDATATARDECSGLILVPVRCPRPTARTPGRPKRGSVTCRMQRQLRLRAGALARGKPAQTR